MVTIGAMESDVIRNVYGEGWAIIDGERKHVRYHIKASRNEPCHGAISAAHSILTAAQIVGTFIIELERGGTVRASIGSFHDAFNADIKIEGLPPGASDRSVSDN